MDVILAIVTVLAPVVAGGVQVVKKATNINKRYLPVMAVVVGVALGAAATFIEAEIVMRLWAGGISGLASVGLFEAGKNIKEGLSND